MRNLRHVLKPQFAPKDSVETIVIAKSGQKEISVVTAMAGRARRSKSFENSTAMCWQSVALPQFPQRAAFYQTETFVITSAALAIDRVQLPQFVV
jgi:hypothetical protein